MEVRKDNIRGLAFYGNLLNDIKSRIRQAQVKATFSANAEMIAMYWDIGRMIYHRQHQEGWGAGVIPRLAKDIQNELPELKGFSERNIKFMVQLYKEYDADDAIGKQAVSQFENVKQLVSQIPWGHNILLMQRVKEMSVRITGFAFVGRQYHLAISDKDFYIDLLFYHLKLRSFIVIELKRGDFKPEYAGKMNFYCSAVDDLLKHPTDQPTVGLVLCQTKDAVLAEYALRDVHKPIGVSGYELTRSLPENLKSSLPSVEEIEAELSGDSDE